MAVTAPKKGPSAHERGKAEREAFDAELLEVIEAPRSWVESKHDRPRTWSQWLTLASVDSQVVVRQVTRGDLSCAYAWQLRDDHPQARLKTHVWFRQGDGDVALLYQQGWRADRTR